MARRLLILGLLLGLLAPATGCALLGRSIILPGSPQCFCDPSHCPHEWGGGCTAGCGRGGPMAGCDEIAGAYDTCAPTCRDGFCGLPGQPVRSFFGCVLGIFHCERWWGPSCGQAYWGGYISDPPDCCDPCDQCGNWTGIQTRGCVGGYGGTAMTGDCGPSGCGSCGCGSSDSGPALYGSRSEPVRQVPQQVAHTRTAPGAARSSAASTPRAPAGPMASRPVPQRAPGSGNWQSGSLGQSAPPLRPIPDGQRHPDSRTPSGLPGGVIGQAPAAPRGLSPREFPDVITDPNSPYAPKLLSVDDRRVGETDEERSGAPARDADWTAQGPSEPTRATR